MNTNNPSELVAMLREKTMPIKQYQALTDEEKDSKIPVGVFRQEQGVQELSDSIYKLSRGGSRVFEITVDESIVRVAIYAFLNANKQY